MHDRRGRPTIGPMTRNRDPDHLLALLGPRFTAQLYLRDAHGYAEERKVTAHGVVGPLRQVLRFDVPAGMQALRLDPSERPGMLHLHAMRLVRDGERAWEWREDAEGWHAFSDCAMHEMELKAPGPVAMPGRDPWIELPIPAAALAHGDLRLEVELGVTALPAQPLADTVDIIVPVYRSLEATRCCIESVLAAPVRTPWRLVVVNDASPEPELTAWLRELAAREPRVLLVEHTGNLGYSGAVNSGMAQDDARDVVHLNSDAEVANDWLDRLRAAAYGDDRVCSVTPFSNNATICSFPRFCEANEFPRGRSVAQVDRSFARANAGQVLDVPTAVGFCMYIRRDCLREIGPFDGAEFGLGYGEENDFCRRAANAGWRNLHALDVFVRHTGGVSFGASKPQRELDAQDKLRRLHPDYERLVREHILRDPAAAARRRAEHALAGAGTLPLFRPSFRTEEVLAEIRDCLDAGWTGPGAKTAEFERRWCDYTGLAHTHFLHSATAGLHLALALLKQRGGWADGDEVITTPLTFVSSNHAILYCGLKPVFADVDEYLSLDPVEVERRITPRTRAVMFVGLGGNTGRLHEVQALCHARGLRLVLDAAHLSGTRWHGRHAGEGVDAAVFSFHAVKAVPTADGGAVCFRDAALDARARRASWMGIDRDTFSRTAGDGRYRWEYDVPEVGYKYHGNDVMAAMALVGLRHLDADNARRRELAAAYDAALGDAVERVPVAGGCESSRHLYQVLVDDRAAVIAALARRGIQSGVHYRDNTEYPMYAGTHCPRARRAADRVLSLPLHLHMTETDAREVAQVLREAAERGAAPARQ
jgi:dTDP-4-amino-4,6-dideoxygalactose transaminase/GT2 family glycosyltransferase